MREAYSLLRLMAILPILGSAFGVGMVACGKKDGGSTTVTPVGKRSPEIDSKARTKDTFKNWDPSNPLNQELAARLLGATATLTPTEELKNNKRVNKFGVAILVVDPGNPGKALVVTAGGTVYEGAQSDQANAKTDAKGNKRIPPLFIEIDPTRSSAGTQDRYFIEAACLEECNVLQIHLKERIDVTDSNPDSKRIGSSRVPVDAAKPTKSSAREESSPKGDSGKEDAGDSGKKQRNRYAVIEFQRKKDAKPGDKLEISWSAPGRPKDSKQPNQTGTRATFKQASDAFKGTIVAPPKTPDEFNASGNIDSLGGAEQKGTLQSGTEVKAPPSAAPATDGPPPSSQPEGLSSEPPATETKPDPAATKSAEPRVQTGAAEARN